MSEPSSGVPGEIADAEVAQGAQSPEPDRVELDIDEEKVEAWDEVKSDYEVEPGTPVPNSMTAADFEPVDDEKDDDDNRDNEDNRDNGGAGDATAQKTDQKPDQGDHRDDGTSTASD